MAGLYEMLMGYQAPATPTVFGNAATTPASIATNQARIDGLRQNVANAQATYNQAKSSYDSAVANANSNRKTLSMRDMLQHPYYKVGKKYPMTETSSVDSTAMTNAQKALVDAQTKLNTALARQTMQRQAGQDAVRWGLTAQNAEQQGIANAAKMYQQAMQGEAVRNAIMNNAIGTVGNFNFGGGV